MTGSYYERGGGETGSEEEVGDEEVLYQLRREVKEERMSMTRREKTITGEREMK